MEFIFLPKTKRPMSSQDWFILVQKVLKRAAELTGKGNETNKNVIQLINSVGKNVSEQWLNTHNVAINQIEAGLKDQSKLINTQYDVSLVYFKNINDYSK